MKQTITFTDFVQAFHNHNRFDNFGYDGLTALFDYLEALEADTGEELELDVIALCCDFTLYGSFAEFQEAYGDDYETMSELENQTCVIPVDDDSFIVQDF